jgi:uncharacterized membrane protein YdbT with pleckstrin-like domain
MAFPRRLLDDGEDVILDLRPHWSFFAPPALALALALAVLVALAAVDAPELVQVVAAALTLVALLRFAVRYARWATTSLVVTTDRLVHRRGVVAKEGIEIPLERVHSVLVRQRLLERVLGCGDLVVESGGEGGRQSFSPIPRPSRVQAEIHRQIEEARDRSTGSRIGAGASRDLSVVEQLERLDELCRRGVVTRSEFEATKALLLQRR